MDLVPKVRLEVLVDDEDAKDIIDVLVKSAGPAASVTARSGLYPWTTSSACVRESAGWTRSEA